MTEIKDGGPAFPKPASEAYGGNSGMSLRQWYAGMALQGILCSESWIHVFAKTSYDKMPHEIFPKVAFRMADGMLAHEAKEREASKA